MQSFIAEAFIYQGMFITPVSYINITLSIMAVIFLTLQTMFIIYSRRKIVTKTYMFDVTIVYKREKYEYCGFLDSGNEVYYQGYPLILVNKNKIHSYQAIDTMVIDNMSNSIIDVIQVDKCIINHQELKDVYVGIIKNIKYDCLLHKQLMGGVI
jgi:hypothetical protein